MFYAYKRQTVAWTIAKELGVSIGFPFENDPRKKSFIERPNTMRCVVNWGCSKVPADEKRLFLNPDINIARSKVKTWEALDKVGVAHPPLYRTAEEAWEKTGHKPYLGRADYKSCGEGIEIYREYKPAKHDFFTKLLPCACELRLHVFGGKVIACQRKNIQEGADAVVHNHAQGGVFFVLRDMNFLRVDRRAQAEEMAIKAVAACGLDFGAVDLFLSDEPGGRKLYILEVNTAPAVIVPKLVEIYTNQFRAYLV